LKSNIKRYILTIFGAILLVLAYPKFNLPFLAWFAFIPFFMAIKDQDSLKRLIHGFIFGFVFFYGTLYWINNSVIIYGGVKWYASIFIVALLNAYLAIYMSLFAFLLPVLRKRLFNSIIITAPVLFVALEHLRGWFLTGFGFSSLGYSQVDYHSLIQIADITGHYGISFIVILVNAAIFTLLIEKKTKKEKIRITTLTCSILIIFNLYGFIKLHGKKDAPKLKSAVIQPDIPQEIKNEATGKRGIWEDCLDLTIQAINDSPEIVIWPESATGTIYNDSYILHSELETLTRILECDIILGSVYRDNNDRIYNTAFHISENGKVKDQYDKIHLLPFGEYMPLAKAFFFISRMVPAISDFSPGVDYKVFTLNEHKISKNHVKFSVIICYESLFPNMVRKFVKKGATFIINISNDAWFGKTAGPYQHFNVNIFRAIENRTPIIRSANTGVSGFIDKYGRVTKITPTFIKAQISETLQLRNDTTFYTRFGDIFAYICIFIVVYGIISIKFESGGKTR